MLVDVIQDNKDTLETDLSVTIGSVRAGEVTSNGKKGGSGANPGAVAGAIVGVLLAIVIITVVVIVIVKR